MQGIKLQFTEETIRQMAERYSDTQAAKRLGIAVSSFFLLRKKYGVPSFTKTTGNRRARGTGELLLPGQGVAHPHQSGLKSDWFHSIDTDEKAYFLGLLTADGHTHLSADGKFFRIELQDPDASVLAQFAASLGSSRPIEGVRRAGKKPSGRLTVYSRPLVEDLTRQGVTSDKPSRFAPPELSSVLRGAYLRGLLDGDGHINAAKKMLNLGSCSLLVIQVVSDWTSEKLSVQPKIHRRKLPSGLDHYRLSFGGVPREVLGWAYSGTGPRIARKQEQADLWMSIS